MAAHRFVIIKEMMRCARSTVNMVGAEAARELSESGARSASMMKSLARGISWKRKKPGSEEPGFKYWPREADTITFQEG